MLPGLRFLFAAIVLATSLLVFGLGAAALFRAAHEEFASIPARRAPPEPQFAQQPEAPPVLAMVRVEPSAADKAIADSPAPATPSEPVASEPAAPAEALPPAEPAKVAAVKADDAPPVPAASPKPEPQAEAPAPAETTEVAPQPPAADPSPAAQPTPVATEATPAPAEAKVAAVTDPPATPSEPALATPAPAMAAPQPAAPSSPESIAAASRIATLGGPEVVVEAPAAPKATEAKKPERNATSKPAHRKERRRIVRAPPVRQAVQLDPFGNPTLVPLTRR